MIQLMANIEHKVAVRMTAAVPTIFFDLALAVDSDKVQNAGAFPTATRINAGLPLPRPAGSGGPAGRTG